MVNYLELQATIRIVTQRDNRSALLDVQACLDKALGELSSTRMYLLDNVSTYIEESPPYHDN